MLGWLVSTVTPGSGAPASMVTEEMKTQPKASVMVTL